VALPVFDDDWFQQDAGEKIRRFADTAFDKSIIVTNKKILWL